jgi:hypothetical protein
MSKLPAFMFYPGDWQKDPSLRRCSKAAKGVWMDMLCLLFECPVRGAFIDAGGTPWSDQDIAVAIGGDVGENLGHIAELVSKGVARRDNRGAIFSRRMVRDEQSRTDAKERMRKHRSPPVTKVVTEKLHPSSESEYEIESPFLEKEDLKPPKSSDELIEKIARLHPANWHWAKSNGIQIPQNQCAVIVDAIGRDGIDLVLAGTKNYAEAVEKWPVEGRAKSVKGIVRFYSEMDYLRDPSDWELPQAQQAPSDKPCKKHPDSGLTQWGTCWACYSEKNSAKGANA